MASPSPGIRNEPLVRRASAQNAPGAAGSPSIGIRMTLAGTRLGYLPSARSNSLSRPSPSMVLRIAGGVAPWVGRPSVMMKTLSGAGLSVFISANAFSRLVPSVRHRAPQVHDDVGQRLRIAAVEPASRAVRHHRPRLDVEREHLELRLRRDLRGEPVDRRDGAPPLLRHQAPRLRHVAQADHVDDRFVQHARRDVDEDDDALAAELEAAQVLAVAGADEALHAVAGLARVRRACDEPLLCSSSICFRSALSFSIASRRDIVVLSASASCSLGFSVSSARGRTGLPRARPRSSSSSCCCAARRGRHSPRSTSSSSLFTSARSSESWALKPCCPAR